MTYPRHLVRREHARRTVQITMSDGAKMEGQLVIPAARAFGEVLNSSRTFFEFETREGEKVFLSKSAILAIQVKDLPRADTRSRHAAGQAIASAQA